MKIKQQLRQAKILRIGGWLACAGLLFLVGCLVFPSVLTGGANAAIGAAVASNTTLSLDVTHNTTTLNLTPIPGGGTFATSFDSSENNENSTINVTTDNFKGYTLSIKASTTGDNASRLVNSSCLTDAESNDYVDGDDCYIESLGAVSGVTSAGITEEAYSAAANTQYNNTWAYLPSVHGSVANTNYLPAPTTSEDILMVTNVANSTADVYTIAMGARVDTAAPKGTYQNTFTVMAVGNPAIYDISYNANAGGATVNGMPAGAEIGEITGDTSGSVTLSANVPARDGYVFAGWNLEPDGTGTTYQPGASFGIDQTISNSNIVLYAMWTGCAADTICYVDNGAGSTTKMGNQSVTSNQDATLWASNFQRTGYGFAGWNTQMDGNGTNYGPNQTINMDLSDGGLILYAKWVASAGDLQDWNGCTTSLSSGYMTALTDTRDNSTYAVAKLADGNCWMVENLRLGNTYNNDGEVAAVVFDAANMQGLGGVFSGLANPEAVNFGDSNMANSLYTTDTTATDMQIIEGSSTSMRFPRFNNNNTASAVVSMTAAGQNVYSYGNYYTWAAAMANTSQFADAATSEAAGTSICPRGWQLPVGGTSSTPATLSFAKLDQELGGTGLDQAATSSLVPSERWRAYPNNFLYSSEFVNDSSVGTSGWYWTASASNSNAAYRLNLSDSTLSPGGSDADANKYYGMSVRCVMAASTGE